MRRKVFSASALILALSLSALACGAAEIEQPHKISGSFLMGTGSATGNYYAFGSVLAQVINNHTGSNITVTSTGGSVENIRLLKRLQSCKTEERAMRLFMVRHGETAWNREGRFQGQIDVPLNETGMRQADMAAERFRGFKLEAVFSSPLARARVTGEKTAAAADCGEFVLDDGFMEINHGEWEGMTTDEVERKYGNMLETWKTNPQRVKMPGANGESLHDVELRAAAALERRVLKNYSGDVLLASHDAVLKMLISHYVGLPVENYWRLRIPNASVSYLDFNGAWPVLGLLGDVSHLGQGFDSFVSKSL